MKKKTLIIPLLLFAVAISLLTLTACGGDVCQHRDADDNSLCDKCGESYADGKDIEDEPSDPDGTACRHSLADVVYTARVEPSCTAMGNVEYWECTACDKYFSDLALTSEIARANILLPAQHKNSGVIKHTRVEPSCTVAGNIEYWECTACNKYFSDSALATEVKKSNVILAARHGFDSENYCAACDYQLGTDGILYNSGIGGYYVTGIVTAKGDVVIANRVNDLPVVGIHSQAFINCLDLTSISIPSTVTYVEDEAFSGCKNLRSVKFADNSRLNSIGTNAFYNCSGLTSITIPDGVTSIGSSAFDGCSGLASITLPFVGATKDGTSNTHFGYIFGASDYSSNSYYVPETLKSVVITGGREIGSNAFRGCSGLTEITIPNSVTSIGSSAFYNCSGLTSIIIPDGVTSIGNSAFSGCSGLKGVYITDIAKWCNISFGDPAANPLFYARKLYLSGNLVTNLVIPNGVTKIGSYAFWYCSGLTSITIPNSVTNIGSSAFNGCSGLTSITIPNSVTTIGSYAFSGCSGLTSITLPFVGATKDGTSNTHFGYIFGASDYSSNSYYVPETLKSVVITGGREIGSNAFRGCSGLTEITIPNSVTSIGSSAFYNCSGLTSIIIPDGVTSIGNSAFSGCSGLKGVYITDIAKWCNISFGDSSANPLCEAQKLYLNGNLVTNLVIPNSVKSIGSYAFFGCPGLTSVTIGDGVTSIGDYAFGGCSGLTSITIPNSVTSIGDYAFWYCSGLTSITILSGVTSIGNSAFVGCSGLTSITIPNSVTSIGYSAFGGCSGLMSTTLPFVGATKDGTSNTHFGFIFGASYNSENSILVPAALKSVIITGGRCIDSYAFYGCSKLTSVTIGDGVTSIERYAFEGCSGLTSVTFENPNGWIRSSSPSGTGTSISATSLSDTGTAAKYLTSTYRNYYWKRS